MSEIKAANGAAVKFNAGDVTVKYDVSGTKITGVSGTATPIIYIPVTNPVSTTYTIQNVKVDFAGGADSGSTTGTVTDMWVYFGNTFVYNAGLDWTYTSTFDAKIPNNFKIADASSYGVLVGLKLNLPSTGSYITLYSVDVTFKQ
ncbi:hypothetical protein DL768_010845 [Monosporascus sp. mg162]|nr:hypothetical protein DL768_010845 [Monosporascus sp. mg162]